MWSKQMMNLRNQLELCGETQLLVSQIKDHTIGLQSFKRLLDIFEWCGNRELGERLVCLAAGRTPLLVLRKAARLGVARSREPARS